MLDAALTREIWRGYITSGMLCYQVYSTTSSGPTQEDMPDSQSLRLVLMHGSRRICRPSAGERQCYLCDWGLQDRPCKK